ncbi:MAG: efflux system, outer rane lipoprotein NodT family [Labilithrix sp.]|nr:efflux system, outer rane lipoprotein NodT family [Labilithrix sp.]
MFRVRLSSSVLTLACASSLALGCAPSLKGNDAREPNRQVPASFGGASQETTSAAQKKWSEFFDSAELRGLIESALKGNQELNIRVQEIIIARNEVSARQGEYLPKVNAGAGAGVEKVGKHTSQGASDEAHGVPENLGNFTFGLTGTWEVDIWKKLRNAAKAADLRYLSSIEGRNFMVTQIVAEIARSYFELIAIDNQLDVLKRNVEVQTDALEVVKLQKQAARVTELAVQRFEAEVFKNKSRLYDLEQEKIQTENRINFLVGRYPQPVSRDAQKFKEPVPDVIQSGLPSQLLENRPDVRQAELDLAAAKLDVKVAKAAFYPSLSIDAAVGYRSFNAEHLVATPESLLYGVAGNLTAPLLNRKAIEAQYRSANARQVQAVFNYERTLLQAFTDVANQVAMIGNLQKSYELQSRQVEALAQSSEVSKILFQSARADYMEVLLTRRDSLDAEMELIETKKRQLQAMVNIYQALGGGWRSGT